MRPRARNQNPLNLRDCFSFLLLVCISSHHVEHGLSLPKMTTRGGSMPISSDGMMEVSSSDQIGLAEVEDLSSEVRHDGEGLG